MSIRSAYYLYLLWYLRISLACVDTELQANQSYIFHEDDILKLSSFLGFTEGLLSDAVQAASNSNYGDVEDCATELPVDCAAILQKNETAVNGVYEIKPISRVIDKQHSVWCDMHNDGGGWTVIQRRGDYFPNYDFVRKWDSYKQGFGYMCCELWIGNDMLFAMTNQKPYELMITLGDWEGRSVYARYSDFWIDDELNNYRLHVKGYSGNAGDSLSEEHDGAPFSTIDRDNDGSSERNCAEESSAGWWFTNCFQSSLNGKYYKNFAYFIWSSGIHWRAFKGPMYSLKSTVMKIRPKDFKAKKNA